MAHGDFKNSTRRTASNKILHNKAFSFAENTKNMMVVPLKKKIC